MGSSEGDEDERPVHRVTVAGFLIARFPVTNGEYARFVRATGHPPPAVRELPLVANGNDVLFREFAAAFEWDGITPPIGRGDHPVVLVTFDDAAAYCRWIAREIGMDVQLPTEAQWERAARGGADGLRYPWGQDIDPSRANYLDDPASKAERGTVAVGRYPPNGFGLYDVIGNVWEWVLDFYAHDYYDTAPARDPRGPDDGAMRVVRGGSWLNDQPSMLRCAYRHRVPLDTYAYSIGFRIACAADQP